MASTFNQRLFPNEKRIEVFSTLHSNMNTLICGVIFMTTVTWAVYDYRDWVHCGERELNKCRP